MAIALNPEFLTPCIIGVGCLLFAIRILLSRDTHIEPLQENETMTGESVPAVDTEHAGLEPGRKVFYALLFAGLGVASVIFGFSAEFPILHYVAKGAIILTIIISIGLNVRNDRKSTQDKIQQEMETKTETKPDI